MTKIRDSGADGIYIGGISTNNGGQLMKDKVQVVGPHNEVQVVVSDGFVISSLFPESGGPKNVNGIYGTAPTIPPEQVTGAGKEFIDQFTEAEGGKNIEVYTIYAAACAQVVVEAIANSDGSRESVVEQMMQVDIPDSVVGPMSFDENGDPREKFETIYQAKGGKFAFHDRIAVE